MALRLAVGDATKIRNGMWSAALTPAEVRRFGDGKSRIGARSVVGVTRPNFDNSARVLSVDPDETTVLNIGGTAEAIIIDLGENGSTHPQHGNTIKVSDEHVEKAKSTRTGDAAFLAECRLHLDDHLVGMAERLLSEIRRRYTGELYEGKARKWVNHPANFVALTIQNRDQSFAVHVKGEPSDFRAPSLEIKPDRGSYSRFKLKHENQMNDTISVVLASARRSER